MSIATGGFSTIRTIDADAHFVEADSFNPFYNPTAYAVESTCECGAAKSVTNPLCRACYTARKAERARVRGFSARRAEGREYQQIATAKFAYSCECCSAEPMFADWMYDERGTVERRRASDHSGEIGDVGLRRINGEAEMPQSVADRFPYDPSALVPSRPLRRYPNNFHLDFEEEQDSGEVVEFYIEPDASMPSLADAGIDDYAGVVKFGDHLSGRVRDSSRRTILGATVSIEYVDGVACVSESREVVRLVETDVRATQRTTYGAIDHWTPTDAFDVGHDYDWPAAPVSDTMSRLEDELRRDIARQFPELYERTFGTPLTPELREAFGVRQPLTPAGRTRWFAAKKEFEADPHADEIVTYLPLPA